MGTHPRYKKGGINNVQTECPHCHSLFHIREEQLDQADGQVQCGHCLAIFSAQNPYRNQQHDDVLKAQTDEHNSIDFDQDDALNDVVPAELRAEDLTRGKTYSTVSSLLWSIGILLLILIGLAQLAYYQRYELVKYPQLKNLMQTVCQQVHCQLPAPKDTSRIKLTSKNVYTHPNIEQALMINATMVNRAEFKQSFPILEIRFENIRGETVAARRFKASEYMGIPENQITAMQPGEPISFNIEIRDPGTDVVSYAFDFL